MLGSREVSRLLGCSPRRVVLLARDGKISAVCRAGDWRFRYASVLDFVERCTSGRSDRSIGEICAEFVATRDSTGRRVPFLKKADWLLNALTVLATGETSRLEKERQEFLSRLFSVHFTRPGGS